MIMRAANLFFSAAMLFPAFLSAGGPADAETKAVETELSRSMLSLHEDGKPRPYFMAYTLYDYTLNRADAEFGAVTQSLSLPGIKKVQADLRVGTPELDNSFYLGGQNDDASAYYSAASVSAYPAEKDPLPLRNSLWLLTDSLYRSASDAYSKKKSFIETNNITDLYSSLTPAEAVKASAPGVNSKPGDLAAMTLLVKKISGVFKKYPSVATASSRAYSQKGYSLFVNSEGTEIKKPYCSGRLSFTVTGYTADEYKVMFNTDEDFCNIEDVPAEKEMISKAENTGRLMEEVSGAKAFSGTYIGPVMFPGKSAADFFNYLFVDNLTPDREIWRNNSKYYMARRSGELLEKLDMRVMSPFISVTDDPRAAVYEDNYLPGHYDYDEEGFPAKKTDIVERGVLRDYFMGRAATKDFSASNGHARGGPGTVASPEPSNLFINPDPKSEKTVSEEELKRLFLKTCREQELEYCIRFDRVAGIGYIAYKVYPSDGREEMVHSVSFGNSFIPRALRDISAASSERTVSTYYANGAYYSVVAPDIIVKEMEIKQSYIKPSGKPLLPNPLAGSSAGK